MPCSLPKAALLGLMPKGLIGHLVDGQLCLETCLVPSVSAVVFHDDDDVVVLHIEEAPCAKSKQLI